MANGFDKEYSTQYFPEVDFLKEKGINPTFVKSNEYGIRLHNTKIIYLNILK